MTEAKKSAASKPRKSTRRRKADIEREPGAPLLIKKYPNRRLYNTATSAYIVLDDVVQLVRDDVPFMIEDTKTGEDITRSILNQIIFEQETKPSDFHFPLEFQKQLISMYGNAYGPMVPDFLTQSLKLLGQEREEMTKAVGSAIENNARTMMDYSRSLAKQNMDMWKKSMSMFGFGMPGSDTKARQQNGGDEELREIQQQIDALQERLKSLSAKKAGGK